MKRILKLFIAISLSVASTQLSDAQSSKTASFFSSSGKITVTYFSTEESAPVRDASFAGLYKIDTEGTLVRIDPSKCTSDGAKIVLEFSNLKYGRSEKYGTEYRLYLPLIANVSGLEVCNENGTPLDLEAESPDAPVSFRGLSRLGSVADIPPGDAPVNQLQRALDTKIIDADSEPAVGPVIRINAGESVQDVIRKARKKLRLNRSLKFPSVRQRRDRLFYEWNHRHAKILEHNARTNPNVALIGDSITHYWGDEPTCRLNAGEEHFKKLFEGWRTTNLGYGWDRIENMLWRVDHGEFDGYNAEHIFVMAGTNNVFRDTNEEIADGVIELVRQIRIRQPKAKIHIVRIYPRRGVEERLRKLNDRIETKAEGLKNVDIINVDAVLTGADGKIIESLFNDGCHPNSAGYERVARVYEKYLTSR